jgi:hypothetical protein
VAALGASDVFFIIPPFSRYTTDPHNPYRSVPVVHRGTFVRAPGGPGIRAE